MNNYELNDFKGRQVALPYLKKEFPTAEFKEIREEFSRWDLEMNNNGRFMIECKNRKCKSTTYDSIYIDESKINACIRAIWKEKDSENRFAGFYLCVTYSDGVCKLWNIIDLMRQKKFKYGKMFTPVSSTEDKGGAYEDVLFFQHSDAFKVITK